MTWHRNILGFALAALAMLGLARPAYADGAAWDDAISREVSLYAGSPSGFRHAADAISREVTVYAGQHQWHCPAKDAVSREVTVMRATPMALSRRRTPSRVRSRFMRATPMALSRRRTPSRVRSRFMRQCQWHCPGEGRCFTRGHGLCGQCQRRRRGD